MSNEAPAWADGKGFHFPLFIDLNGRRVVLVGGGSIARRRINALLQFGCELVVIAPELKGSAEGFTHIAREFRSGDTKGAFLVIAATDSRAVNHAVGEEAKANGIFVSVADCLAECTFFFPAICTGKEVIAGVTSRGKAHHAAAVAAMHLRKALRELDENSDANA